MKLAPSLVILAAATLAIFTKSAPADYPKPSPYPTTWELKFEHSIPKRIVVRLPDGPHPYWYMTYSVTNNTDQEQTFFPYFEILTEDGKLIRSDKNVAQTVFDSIKARENKKFLEPEWKIEGTIRIGEDQTRDGVAIWPEPAPRLGHFSIFVGGLSGESATVNGPDDKPVILRKTLQLNFHIRGDEFFPGEDEVNPVGEKWIMR
jgi:hypothetical protein